jgi:hypothetical protein
MSGYIYTPRELAMGRHTYVGPDPVAQIRAEGLNRRYIQAYGAARAAAIFLREDVATREDLRRWRALGRSAVRVSA